MGRSSLALALCLIQPEWLCLVAEQRPDVFAMRQLGLVQVPHATLTAEQQACASWHAASAPRHTLQRRWFA